MWYNSVYVSFLTLLHIMRHKTHGSTSAPLLQILCLIRNHIQTQAEADMGFVTKQYNLTMFYYYNFANIMFN